MISVDRIERLKQLGSCWVQPFESEKASEQWQSRCQQLVEYTTEHGHCNVPSRCQNNPTLGCWVASQRDQKKKNKLSAERIRRLNQLGFCWVRQVQSIHAAAASKPAPNKLRQCDVEVAGMSQSELWDFRSNQLKEHKNEHGNCSVPDRYQHNISLGCWVSQQRFYKKKHDRKKTSVDRIKRPEQLGFCWVKAENYLHYLIPRQNANQEIVCF